MSLLFKPAAHFMLLLLSLLTCVTSTGCTVFDIANAPISSRGYVKTADLAYGDAPRQKLDVYVPRIVKPNARVVIFFYGGSWQSGKKADYRFVADALTSKGYVAVLADYRLYPNVTFPAFVQDGALAVRWTHDHITQFGGDPSHIYLMGHSAGAYIAAMLTLDPRYLKGVGLDRSDIRATVALAGPYDFVPAPSDRGVFNMGADDTRSPKMEPINFVDGHAPPMLLLQGLQDKTVDPRNAFELWAKIHVLGGESRVIAYPDRSHVPLVAALAWEFRWLAPVLRDASAFIDEH